jgi:hypothetical protein
VREIGREIVRVAEALHVHDHVEARRGKTGLREVAHLEARPLREPPLDGEPARQLALPRLEGNPEHPRPALLRQPEGGPTDAAARVEHRGVRANACALGELRIGVNMKLLQRRRALRMQSEVQRQRRSAPVREVIPLRGLVVIGANALLQPFGRGGHECNVDKAVRL